MHYVVNMVCVLTYLVFKIGVIFSNMPTHVDIVECARVRVCLNIGHVDIIP